MTSAGEVEQFAYCPHNWLLARQGESGDGPESRRGIAAHAGLGRAQRQAERGKKDYREGLQWSFRVLALASSVTFLALELVYLRASPYHLVLLTTALVLVSSSSGLLAIALDAQRRYRRLQSQAGLVPGRLAASDLSDPTDLLVDPAWGLTGRPDYVVETESGPVPVEVKSGRTPSRPHRSHALQLASYLRLVEATSGRRPSHGLLTYPEGAFRIPWDEAAKADLRGVLDRIKEARAANRADRDHGDVGRCRGCSRRAACDQRLG